MALRMYNTRTQKMEAFEPESGAVTMYICGPTVYAKSHIGHGKSYVTFDVMRRYMEAVGYKVKHMMCITDVADEIRAVGEKEGFSEREIAKEYEDSFFTDMKRLGNLTPSMTPRVSEHIEEMVETVKKLEAVGVTYSKDGQIFMRVEPSFYGNLSHVDMEQAIARGDGGLGSLDLLLWDTNSSGDQWDSPWGRGRPGWHIQCYTFIAQHMGLPIDIHGGGMDLIFPHHESQEIIAHALGGEYTARFWTHNGLILGGQNKMSKSIGNVIRLEELLDRYGPDAVRLFLLSTHYRDHTIYKPHDILLWEERAAAIKTLLCSSKDQWEQAGKPTPNGWPMDYIPLIAEAMGDDLHWDKVVGYLLEIVDKSTKDLGAEEEGAVALVIERTAQMLGLFQKPQGIICEPII
ncbi:MAG: class I tRNA ligase family protein [Candidatus Thermoplasmatota archaeon]|nr:class I tRNA ligase family protein [Candidatus Thermoplasmatota archaeon]